MFFRSRPEVVRVGEPKITGEIQIFEIKTIIKHPNYSHVSRYNDIALVELDEAVRINRYVIPACLWLTTDFDFVKVYASGWGTDEIGNKRKGD
jgi:Trypsin